VRVQTAETKHNLWWVGVVVAVSHRITSGWLPLIEVSISQIVYMTYSIAYRQYTL